MIKNKQHKETTSRITSSRMIVVDFIFILFEEASQLLNRQKYSFFIYTTPYKTEKRITFQLLPLSIEVFPF